MMTADHGEMLGDHHLWRKSYAYEGSARIPLLLRFPDSWDRDPTGIIDRPVGFEDVMPTILDAAGLDVPDTADGRSLLALCDDPNREDWRSAYHGAHAPAYDDRYACQWLVDEDTKFVWNPIIARKRLFDLAADPDEEHDRSGAHPEELAAWCSRLTDHLDGRPEGFVEGSDLHAVGADAWDARRE